MKEERSSDLRGLYVVSFLSLCALLVALILSISLRTVDDASSDIRMRWRYRLTFDRNKPVNSDIALLSINYETMRSLGRFGAGQWLSRKPFCDQLSFFEQYFSPTVVAYDLVFQDDVGADGGTRVTESPERLARIKEAIGRIEKNPTDLVDHYALYDANKFAAEQGISLLSMSFASVMDESRFESIIGAYFRGGVLNQKSTGVKIPGWSSEDVYGDDEVGDDRNGIRIPYVRDISIPLKDIHYQKNAIWTADDFSPNANLPDLELLDYSYLGFLNGPRDPDNIVRRIPLVIGTSYYNDITGETKKMFVPSFSLLSCLLHLGVEMPMKPGALEVYFGDKIIIHTPENGDYRIPIDKYGKMYLNYTVRYVDFDPISLSYAALSMNVREEGRRKYAERYKKYIDGHVVLVCVDLPDRDVGRCPIDLDTSLGLVQLTAVNNILNRDFLKTLDAKGYFLLMVALGLIFTAICHQQKTAKLGFVSGLFMCLYLVASYVALHFSVVVLPFVGPVSYIIICSFLVLTYRFFTEEKAKRLIRGMFSTMVSDKVLAYLESNPQSFSLQGRNMDVSVFFSDVANFTSISEKLHPAKLTELLNSYLTPVTDCILENDGYVDKYVGDGVMAVWGTPTPDEDHAIRACRSALQQQALIDEIRPRLFEKYGAEINVRMGINSGVVIAGNMGSEKKLQYTVMGDVVNLASRLEPVNKDFSTKIIIGNSTRSMIGDTFEVRQLENIVVIGKKEVVPVYELLGEKGTVDDKLLEDMRLYEQALKAFHTKKWAECTDTLVDGGLVERDFASQYLLKRCKDFQNNPPPESWSGEYVRTSKE